MEAGPGKEEGLARGLGSADALGLRPLPLARDATHGELLVRGERRLLAGEHPRGDHLHASYALAIWTRIHDLIVHHNAFHRPRRNVDDQEHDIWIRSTTFRYT